MGRPFFTDPSGVTFIPDNMQIKVDFFRMQQVWKGMRWKRRLLRTQAALEKVQSVITRKEKNTHLTKLALMERDMEQYEELLMWASVVNPGYLEQNKANDKTWYHPCPCREDPRG